MDSGLKTISSLFDGAKKLIIPIYQRPYTWGDEQWKNFWEDVYYHSPEQKYFFGTILIKEIKKKGDFEQFDIVDGQQRIATITIFIYLLLKRLEEHDPSRKLKIKRDKYIEYEGNFKFSVNGLDNEFFQTYILREENENIVFQTPSQRKLFDAKEYFREKMTNCPVKELDRMLEMLEQSEILVYSVKDSAEATLIFETTNDRGKPLTNLEKVKSFLMYRSYLSAGKKTIDLIDRMQKRFGDMYQVLERIKPIYGIRSIKEVEEDQICQYHFIAEGKWSNKYEYQDFLNTMKAQLNELWYKKKHKEIINYIENYSKSLRETFETFELILNYKNKILDDIIYIGNVAIFFPILIISYKRDQTLTKSNFNRILEALEKFSARMYFYNAYRKTDVRYTFNNKAYSFESDKNFKKLEKSILDNISLCGQLENVFNKSDLYYYLSNNAMNYLFWKYENYLRTQFQPKSSPMSYDEFNDKSYQFKITIEHITAQKPQNGLRFIDQTEKFKEEFLHSLGNLTIAPQSSNSSMGNSGWDIKKKYYFEKAPFKTQLELSDFVNPRVKQWGQKAINQRRDKIIEFAVSKWGITNADDE
jgi:hypothetical protein